MSDNIHFRLVIFCDNDYRGVFFSRYVKQIVADLGVK